MTDSNQFPPSVEPNSPSSSYSGGAPNYSVAAPVSKKRWSPLTIVLGLSGIFFVIFLVVSCAVFFSSRSKGDSRSGGSAIFGKGSVAVLELNGVIMDSKKTLKHLEHFEEEENVKAIVVRLNSPGGAVAPSQEIYDAVKKSKKPIIASMSSVAASGAYYVACGTQKIYANAGTITGSIGVIMEFLNLSKLYDWAKVSRYSIKTGKFKDAGAEYRDMTAEERALLQGMVDDVLLQFKTAVSTGRKLSMEQVTAIADGRIFSGNQAKNAHLVDELGTLQDAINDAAKMGGIKGKPAVVYPEHYKRGLLDLISDAGQGSDDEDSQSSVGSANAMSGPMNGAGGIIPMLTRILGAAGAGGSPEADVAATHPGIYWLWMGR